MEKNKLGVQLVLYPKVRDVEVSDTVHSTAASDANGSSRIGRSDGDIRQAVKAWGEDPVQAEARYGHIGRWLTGQVKQ